MTDDLLKQWNAYSRACANLETARNDPDVWPAHEPLVAIHEADRDLLWMETEHGDVVDGFALDHINTEMLDLFVNMKEQRGRVLLLSFTTTRQLFWRAYWEAQRQEEAA